jgi:hypothetical protein
MSSFDELKMLPLKERVKTLEADLKASPMRHHIYNDLPFAVFCYPPNQEWAMRREIGLLKTRLEIDTDRIIATISLADLLWRAIDESEGVEAVVGLERQSDFEAAQLQIQDYLSDPDWRPLPDLQNQPVPLFEAPVSYGHLDLKIAITPHKSCPKHLSGPKSTDVSETAMMVS